MTATFYMENMYNFNPGQADIGSCTPDDENGKFAELEWARESLTYGSLTKIIVVLPVPPQSGPPHKFCFNNRGLCFMSLLEKFLSIQIDLESMSIAYHDKEVEEWRCEETPINSVIFACTGVDAVHYCVVPKYGDSIDESPVYEVSPTDVEDTVVWVAKNFIDFLSMGVAMGSFLYLSCCHECDKKEFMSFFEDSWSDINKNEKLKAIKSLREQFPIVEVVNLFEYIIESYEAKDNHAELRFISPEVKEVKLGHFKK